MNVSCLMNNFLDLLKNEKLSEILLPIISLTFALKNTIFGKDNQLLKISQ